MPDRCVRCGGEDEVSPANEILAPLVEEFFPSAELEELCAQLWLLKLIVFICEQGPGATLCRNCHSAKR